MQKGLKIFVIVLALPVIVLGIKTMFDPISMITRWGMDPVGNTGLNSLRSMVAGILLGGGVMMTLGVWKENTTWFLAAALLMLIVAFGRLLSFGLDGFDSASIPPTVYEIVAASVMIFLDRKLSKS